MKIAYTMAHGRGELDLLLAELAKRLEAKGVVTRGIVQTNSECAPDRLCDMDVQVLPDGDVIRISQSLGKEARGCRLDPDAMAHAVAEVSRSMQTPYDVFLLNKFGKQEGEGKGFRDLIAEAAASGATVIAGTNPLNSEKFTQFADGMATEVPADIDALLAWYDEVNAS
ncbi:Protein of unknown function [Shimia haliotis]|uniref:Nucleoside-triphosphatase THEP1 n=2 Tax=Shimia haliotis TaxID=1280847 RepID=A0A1I4DP97_9RHOB|nr:DUF2478 domain-containing protein [Shimia haliotis]SFK95432.1 Protein of unknown function [Shimia haliotis]